MQWDRENRWNPEPIKYRLSVIGFGQISVIGYRLNLTDMPALVYIQSPWLGNALQFDKVITKKRKGVVRLYRFIHIRY